MGKNDVKNTLNVDLKQDSYSIHVEPGLLSSLNEHIPFSLSGRSVFLLTDDTVKALYAQKVLDALEAQGANVVLLSVEAGEKSKSFSNFEELSNEILSHKATRDSVLVALGGGVVGDLGGFLASTIVRGIPYVQIPTTLLAQVDSSVGGKTAINTSYGKNLIGTFYQPKAVIVDVDVLQTLSDREYKAGVAEVIKYGLINDISFYNDLRSNIPAINERDPNFCRHMIIESCSAKASIVSQDEKETRGVRALLNLGHTFGHALELMAGYNGDVLHGEAVAVGMVLAAKVSADNGFISDADVDDLRALLSDVSLPVSFSDLSLSVDANDMYDLMLGDKKATKDGIGFILLERLGRAIIRKDITRDSVVSSIQNFN